MLSLEKKFRCAILLNESLLKCTHLPSYFLTRYRLPMKKKKSQGKENPSRVQIDRKTCATVRTCVLGVPPPRQTATSETAGLFPVSPSVKLCFRKEASVKYFLFLILRQILLLPLSAPHVKMWTLPLITNTLEDCILFHWTILNSWYEVQCSL
jgi:hypothetical protein